MQGAIPPGSIIDLISAGIALSFALYTLVMRIIAPGRLMNLSRMRKRFGGVGAFMHFVGYTVMPAVFGLGALARWWAVHHR